MESLSEALATHLVDNLAARDPLDALLASTASWAEESFEGALVRLWLIGPGDSCPTCAMRAECADQTSCLHLLASRGVTSRIDGPFRRFPLGARRVGKVPVTLQPLVARADLARLDLADPAWLAAHRIQSFAAWPLEFRDQPLGVLGLFSRRLLTVDDERLLAAGARRLSIALALVNDRRALEAAQMRLEAENARLREELRATRFMPDATGDPGEPLPPPAPLTSLAEVQRDAIERALVQTNGRVSGPRGAAALLGLKPTTLESRMKKLGVRRPGRG